MRFLVMAMAKRESEAGPPPKPEAFAAMHKYNEEAVKAGVLLAAEGLSPTSRGARVQFSGDTRTIIDGPFTEVKSLEEAIEWVKRAPNAEALVEIRKLMDIEDFCDGFTPNSEIAKVKFK